MRENKDMRKKIFILLMIGLLVGWMISYQLPVLAQSITPSPTESSLVTTPVVTNTPSASSSATPTKITSLPKTGIAQYSALFFVISVGVILFALAF